MEKVVALLCVLCLGTCFSLLGAISVKLIPRLKIDKGQFGTMISVFMFACLILSLVMGMVCDKVGYKPVAIFGFAMTAFCIFMFAYAKSYVATLGVCALFGFGAMSLNTAGNTLIPIVLFEGKNPAGASNLGNVFFGVGLLITPLLVSVLFRKVSYEKTLSVLAVVVLLPVVLAILATYPPSKAGFAFSDALALFTEPVVLVGGLVLFCYFSLESTFANWLPAFGKEVFSHHEADATTDETETNRVDASAQRLLSWFAIGMMLGRLLISQVPVITEYGSWFIAGAGAGAGIIILFMTKVVNRNVTRVLAATSGLVFGLCFPTTVGVTFSKFSPEIYGSVFGIIFAIGLLGCVIVPKAIGNMSKNSTIQKSLKYLLPLCVIQIVLAIILGIV